MASQLMDWSVHECSFTKMKQKIGPRWDFFQFTVINWPVRK